MYHFVFCWDTYVCMNNMFVFFLNSIVRMPVPCGISLCAPRVNTWPLLHSNWTPLCWAKEAQ